MNPTTSPDHSNAWRTYLRAIVFLIPSALAWSFAGEFLLPRVQLIWRQAGLTASNAQWLMDSSSSFTRSMPYSFAAAFLILVLVEILWSAWPRFRRIVVACATLIFHTAVLADITSIAIAACLAAPLLAKHQ